MTSPTADGARSVPPASGTIYPLSSAEAEAFSSSSRPHCLDLDSSIPKQEELVESCTCQGLTSTVSFVIFEYCQYLIR